MLARNSLPAPLARHRRLRIRRIEGSRIPVDRWLWAQPRVTAAIEGDKLARLVYIEVDELRGRTAVPEPLLHRAPWYLQVAGSSSTLLTLTDSILIPPP